MLWVIRALLFLYCSMNSRILLLIVGATLLLASCAPSANMSKYNAYRFEEHNADAIPAGKLKVTFLGTSSLLIDDGETQLLTDGFITRPGLFKTGFGEIGCDTNKVRAFVDEYKAARLKAIFCAHSHYDHAMDAPYIAQQTGAVIYGSASTLNIGRGAGLAESSMQLYQPNQVISFGKFKVTILNSKHTPPFNIIGKSNDDLGEQITTPLKQPAKAEAYAEGGAYDVLIQHGTHSILIKASTNWLPGALDSVKADVVFLGVACIGKQDSTFRDNYYNETVGKLKPQIIVPVHWDNFFKPLNPKLKALPKIVDNVKLGFNYIIARTKADGIHFRLMQGKDSVLLF